MIISKFHKIDLEIETKNQWFLVVEEYMKSLIFYCFFKTNLSKIWEFRKNKKYKIPEILFLTENLQAKTDENKVY